MRVFENRMLRKIFGPKRDEVKASGEKYIMRSIMICTHHSILIKSRKMRWEGLQHVWGREACI